MGDMTEIRRYKRKRWTKEEDALVMQHYPHCTMAVLSDILAGRSKMSIAGRAWKLGVRKTEEYIKTAPNSGRFEKGVIPYTKGEKREEYMSAEGIENCKKTQFKKGNKPHTYLPIGTEIMVSGYMYVKVADVSRARKCENWKQKHRLLWESVNGPIPEGHNIQFKDGNPMNITIDNLYIISKEEQMKNNSFVNLPDEARVLLKAIRVLTRQINKRKKRV